MKSKSLFFPAVISLVLFFLFTLFVHLKVFNGLDYSSTVALQNIFSRKFDTFFSFLSLFGSAEMVLVIIFILWIIYKKLNYFSVLLFFAIFHFFEFLGKYFVNHPSPPLKFLRYDIPFSFPSSVVSTGSSFPSGHVGRNFFLTVILFFIISKSNLPKVQKQFFFRIIILFDVIMFISRIYLGEHWLTDVIGGGLLGVSFGFFALLF